MNMLIRKEKNFNFNIRVLINHYFDHCFLTISHREEISACAAIPAELPGAWQGSRSGLDCQHGPTEVIQQSRKDKK